MRRSLLRLLWALTWVALTVTVPGRAVAQERAGGPPGSAAAAPFIAKARALKLADDVAWRRLGHWRSGLFGVTSEADGPDFFLAKDGKTDPEAELEATLHGFFADLSYVSGAQAQHPICRYPARLAWLNEKLQLDFGGRPMPTCPKFEAFWKRINPGSATLVFSSYYLNNPASAFGHTFLRINRDEGGNGSGRGDRASERQQLLDNGVDYSATVDTGNALVYGLKGLTGMFPGTFHVYPYYYKVREYNDYESRDLWEYDLALSKKQLVMLVAHLWELGSTYFDYFYLTENCSYHVLGALEAAAPEVELMKHLRGIVIPADTVRALYKNPGLVGHVRFRPALRKQFRVRVEGMSEPELAAVEALGNDVDAPLRDTLPPEGKIRVLDAAMDLNDIRYARELLKETDSTGAQLKQRLLERRAAIPVPSAPLSVTPPWDKAPHLGHGSGRITLGAGLRAGTAGMPLVETTGAPGRWGKAEGYWQLGFRLAGHDLADPPRGQPELSQINFFDVRARLYPRKTTLKALELEELALVRIVSLTAIDRFDKKPSWKVRAGAFRVRDRGCAKDDCLVVGGEVGGGLAASLFQDGVTVFGTLDLFAGGSGALRGGPEGTPLRIDAGPTLGLRLRPSASLVGVVSGHLGYLPFQVPRTTGTAEAALRWEISPGVAVGVEGRAQPRAVDGQLQGLVYY